MNLLFRYTLINAWGTPISEISVFGGGDNTARFFVAGEERFLCSIPEEKTVSVDPSVIRTLEAMARDLDVKELEELEHILVMDGVTQEFSFHNGDELVTLRGYNLQYCPDEPSLYPNAMKMIRFLESAGQLLIPLGVDEGCFLLG